MSENKGDNTCKPIFLRYLGRLLSVLLPFTLGLIAVPLQQWILSPRKVTIEFKLDKPFVIKTLTSGRFDNKLYNIYPFRFKIKNDSSAIANNCVVMITQYWHVDNKLQEREEPNFEPLRIGWSSEARVDIGPGNNVFVPFMKIAEAKYQIENEIGDYGLSGDQQTPQLRFAAPTWPRWMSSHISPGKYRFLVIVYFDNRKPLQEKFEVNWTGVWSDDYDNMLKQVTIKKID